MRRLLFGALLVAGCHEETAPPPLPPAAPPSLVVPGSLQELDFEVETFAMPGGWDGSADWYVAAGEGGDVVAGSDAGLFALGQPVELIDAAPVRGLAEVAGLGWLVVHDHGLAIYDGEMLYPSALDAELDGEIVLAVARQGEALWLTTDGPLRRLEGDVLVGYPELVGVSALATHDATTLLTLVTAEGETLALREEAEAFELEVQSLGAELVELRAAAPGPHGRVFALAGEERAIHERVAVDGGVAWLPLALGDEPVGATGIATLAPDPVGGALWLADGGAAHLWRLDGEDVVSHVPWPAGVGSGAIAATADGAVWLSDGASLVRVGPASPPPSYAADIAPFYSDNCKKCHEDGGEAVTLTRFGDYDAFALLVDDIIDEVESGRMPSGDNTLDGDPQLPRLWRDGGMRP
jgi:hypothetical protein